MLIFSCLLLFCCSKGLYVTGGWGRRRGPPNVSCSSCFKRLRRVSDVLICWITAVRIVPPKTLPSRSKVPRSRCTASSVQVAMERGSRNHWKKKCSPFRWLQRQARGPWFHLGQPACLVEDCSRCIRISVAMLPKILRRLYVPVTK